jgi:hypothetical protein
VNFSIDFTEAFFKSRNLETISSGFPLFMNVEPAGGKTAHRFR